MTFAIFGKAFSHEHLEYFSLLVHKLSDSGCRIILYEPFHAFLAENHVIAKNVETFSHHDQLRHKADFLLSVGGDGTLLDSVQWVRDAGIPIAGINIGRMGFLSSIPRHEIIPAVEDILKGNYRIEKRSLIRIEAPSSLFGDLNFALNELSINKMDTSSMLVIHVWVDDHLLQTYWADGLIIATPTGSTAYSLSCGGPIIAPAASTFVITPIAPHNLTARPVVIPDTCSIRIRVDGRQRQALVCLDSRSAALTLDSELRIGKAGFEVNLLQRDSENFFSTIRAKLNWGADIRN